MTVAARGFELNALGALEWVWGEAYAFTVPGEDLWRARRLDGIGGAIEAASPEELRAAILDDYITRPVRRG